jgi:hypothetical protein
MFLSTGLLKADPSMAILPLGNFGEYILNPFVLSILALFLFSSLKLSRYLARLPAQHAALEQVMENYQEVERKQESDPELIKQDLLRSVDPDSIAAQRVLELKRISARGGDFDQVALAEVLAAREGAKVSIARYVASVLVLLGLCGAIWGLSGLVVNMGPALKDVQEQLDKRAPEKNAGASGPSQSAPDSTAAVQASFATLVKTMSDSLTNTRTAFFASLTGILASVLLLFSNWFVSKKQIDFLTAIEDSTATRLIPVFKPPHEASQLAEVVATFREGLNYMVRLSGELDVKVSTLGGSLDNLFAIVRKFGEGADALRGHQDLVYQAQEEMMGVVSQFMGLTSRIEAHQAGAHVDLEGVVQAVAESNKNLAISLETWQARHEEMLQRVEQGAKQAHAETKEARELAQKGFDELTGLIRKSVRQQVEALKTQSIGVIQQQETSTREHLSQVFAKQQEFVTALQNSINDSNGHKELLAGLATTIGEERNTFSEQMENMLNQNREALTALIAEQHKLLDISGMRRVEEGLVQFVKENRSQFGALLERQGAFDQEFGQLSKLAGRLGLMLKVLVGVAAVSIPVFTAMGVMFIFDLRPQDLEMRLISMGAIMLMIFLLAWFLRAKT